LTLPGDPQQSGLVIVQGALVSPLKGWSKVFAGGDKEEVLVVTAATLISEANASSPGRPIPDANGVLFAPVTPGRHRLADVGFLRQRTTSPVVTGSGSSITTRVTYDVTPAALQKIPALTFDVKPGQVVYIGYLRMDYNEGSLTDPASITGYELVSNPQAERATLSVLLKHLDPASPWRAALAERLRAQGN
jgi:hypothetical protein